MQQKGVEVRKRSVRVYFYWEGQLCREPVGPPTEKNIQHAERLAQIIRYELEAGTFDYARHFPDSPRVQQSTFGYYLDLLLSIKKNQLAYSSYRGDESKARVHIRPKWGDTQIEKIDHIDLQEWIQSDLARLHNKTVREVVSIMRQTFDLYSTRNKRLFNPTKGIKIKLPDNPDPDPFTLEEINKILGTPTKREQELNLAKFMLWDGPRLSEALALCWEDVVSVEKGVIRYQRAMVRYRFKVTKTRRSTRTHTLLKPAREALQAQYELTGKLPPIEVEVTDRDNKTVRKQKVRPVFLNSKSLQVHYGDQAFRERFWETHLKAAGVRYRPPSQCRHTFISQMLSTGAVPLPWIANHLGHTTIDMIQRTYGKWMKQDGADIHAMIEGIFRL
jgi:integrase